jgi:hypothetical protein
MKKGIFISIAVAGLSLASCDDPVVASDKDVRKDGKVVGTDTVSHYNAQEDLTPPQEQRRDSAQH